MTEFSIQGGVVLSGTRILLPLDLATIEPGVAFPVGTIQSPAAIGTLQSPVAIGTVQSPIPVGPVGTIQSPVGVGTILAPVAVMLGNVYAQTNVLTSAVVSSSVAATLLAGTLQDLVVDAVFGTVVTGSIIPLVMGVDPQTGLQTATLFAGTWFGGTLRSTQRVVAAGPLGALVAVIPENALGGTIGAGSILGVTVTAEQSGGR